MSEPVPVQRSSANAKPTRSAHATTEAPALAPVAIHARLTDGLEWARTWRECFMGNLARRFVAEVRGAPPEGPTFQDGYRAQLGLAALAASLSERRWVAVPGPTGE